MDRTGLRVLLVDDDEDDFVMTRELLSEVEGAGYSIEWVSTYEAALEAIKSNNHDVYLFDYRMGERTGLELLRYTLSVGSKVPVILLTGQGDKEVDLEAMKAGASDYLVKGKIDVNLLERSIRYAIERKRDNDQIHFLAYNDSLTSLPNRLSFKKSLEHAIEINKSLNKLTALLFLDLDDFKRINDTFGHTVGDDLLKEVADRLSVCVRKSDQIASNISSGSNNTVARLGGDEFTILLSVDDIRDASYVAQRIIDRLSVPFILQGNEVFVTTSIGIVIHPLDGDDVDTLLKNADAAMYYAKNRDKNNYKYYKKSMNEFALKRLTMESKLRKAIENRNFILHYQPQIEMSSGKIVCMEALIRWKDPDAGIIPPAEFIPLAEETGMIIPVGEWIMRTACLQNSVWQKAGLTPLRISVNISGRQFRHKSIIETISGILADTGLAPRYLELEITENILMENVETTMMILDELRNMGLRISMDDFGTGYSSFSYLKRIPLNVMKIDRSFIKDIHSSTHDRTIISAIILMAHGLEMNVIADGVETEQQLSFLRENKCDVIQGCLLSRPLSVEDATALLAKETSGKGIGLTLCRRNERHQDILPQDNQQAEADVAALRLPNENRKKLQGALVRISALINSVIEAKDYSVIFSNPNVKKCYEIKNCKKEDCPCYGKDAMRCWKVAGTYCGGKVQGVFAQKFGDCSLCEVYKVATTDPIYQIGENFNNMMHILETKNTELRDAFEELKKITVQLEKSNAELQEFANIASHDLQEPLRKVYSFGERLKRKYASSLDNEGRDYINRMIRNASRMQMLLDGLLDYSQIKTRARPFTQTSLSEIVQEALSNLEVSIDRTDAKVELRDLPAIDADPLQMQQLFQHLIGNALKFYKTDEQPAVKVSGALVHNNGKDPDTSVSDKDFCEITIEDNGIGFDKKYAERIFGVFQRLHGQDEYEGSGIGLTLCKKIVERHSGTIKAKSRPGEGASFIITLPVKHI